MAAEKCLYAYDYVDLKDREYVKKHAKKRHLGDIEGKHRYRPRPSTATVVRSLVTLDFPETRAINTTTAGHIISDQRKQIRNTYQKTQWKETLNGWSRPASSMEERVQTPVEVEQRPHTSASVSIPDGSKQLQMNPVTLRPFSTGAIRRPSRKPPQASGFMWVRMKRNGSSASNIRFKRITEEIRLQWEEEDKKEREDVRKEKSQSPRRYDAFAGQWLSFAAGGMDGGGSGEEGGQPGGTGGVVAAFTGENNAEYYNIEGKVGAGVATQLRLGNKIRIGVNGTVQSDSLRVRKWRQEVERAESVASNDSFTTTDSDLFKLSGQDVKPKKKKNQSSIVPLCWDDQLGMPDVKVMEAKEKPAPSAKQDLSERHPVVFEKLVKDDMRPKRGPKLETYRLSHRTKSKRNLDGTESLSNRITVITVDQIDEDRESLSSLDYEEILQRSLEVEHSPEEEAPPVLLHPEDSKKPTEQILLSPFGEGSLSESSNARSSGMVEKPPTPRSSPLHSSANSDAGPVPHSMTPKPRSMPLTSPVPSSPSIVSGRPRTGSQRSQRAQSSNGKGRYSFSQPPTPRNLNSPHPNLAKPGQLPRTGISSINPGVQEGEHEYIKISQQLLPGSERTQSQMDNMVAISRVGERNAYPGSRDDLESLGQNPSVASLDTMDSMNVEGDQTGNHLPDDVTDPPCSCSPEAKRVVSAALSRVSIDSSNIINIPMADMNMSLSDLNSMSDMDPLASYSSFRGSLSSDLAAAADLLPEGGAEMDQLPQGDHNHNHLSDSVSVDADLSNVTANKTDMSGRPVGVAKASSASSTSSQRLPSAQGGQEDLGYIINQVDGLELTQTEDELTEQQPKSSSAKKSNRTVTFAEEIGPPSVPNCTPESTPRDPTDFDSERDDTDTTHDTQETEQRPQSAESNRSTVSDELNALRSKIKSDLVETQQQTQTDIRALEAQRNNGKT